MKLCKCSAIICNILIIHNFTDLALTYSLLRLARNLAFASSPLRFTLRGCVGLPCDSVLGYASFRRASAASLRVFAKPTILKNLAEQWTRLRLPHFSLAKIFLVLGDFLKWWVGTESNRRHMPFQGIALPTELPTRDVKYRETPLGYAIRSLESMISCDHLPRTPMVAGKSVFFPSRRISSTTFWPGCRFPSAAIKS